jgi:drug/metabolite transporter (DMT)-like permease
VLPDSPPFPFAGEAAALLSGLFWAVAGVVFTTFRGRVAPAAINLAKNATATLCFAGALAVGAGAVWPSGLSTTAHVLLALSGLLGLSACDTLYLRSMHRIGVRRASLVFMLAPVLVFVAAWFPPFRQTATASEPLTWLGMALALAGIAGAASEEPDVALEPGARGAGLRDAVLASVLQAAGNLLARAAYEEGATDAIEGAYLRLLWGSVGLVAGGLVLGRLREWRGGIARSRALPRIAAAAFLGTFLGIGLNQAGIGWSASTGVAATLNSLSPVWLIPLSAWFLGERHGLRAWASTLLAVAGVALLSA